MILGILLSYGMTAFADGLPDMTPLRRLFGESGVNSFHLENFGLESIDFDTLLRIVGSSSIDYSNLNYDAFLALLDDPEMLSGLGVESVDHAALNSWLRDPETGKKLNGLMLTARQGGSFSAAVQSLSGDSDFLACFSAITNGRDFSSVMDHLASGNAPDFLNKAASALLSAQTGTRSENARIISNMVQEASAVLGWKK